MESNEKNQANGKEIQSKPQKELLKSVVVKKLFDPFLGAGAAGFGDSCLSGGIYCSPHCPKR